MRILYVVPYVPSLVRSRSYNLIRCLVQRGHQVTVYCRSHHVTYPDQTYKGMRLIKLPTIANNHRARPGT